MTRLGGSVRRALNERAERLRREKAETDLKKSEEQLRFQAYHDSLRYRGLLEAAPDGIVVVNQDGEIVLLNARAESQFGYRRDELLGQKVTTIIPEGFAERLVADGTRTAAEALRSRLEPGLS